MPEEKRGRRCYETKECPLHEELEEKAKAALPRWVFIAFLVLIASLGSWREYSNAEMKKEMTDKVEKLEHLIKANNDFFHTLSENLIEIKINQSNVINNQKDLIAAIRRHEQETRGRINERRGTD